MDTKRKIAIQVVVALIILATGAGFVAAAAFGTLFGVGCAILIIGYFGVIDANNKIKELRKRAARVDRESAP